MIELPIDLKITKGLTPNLETLMGLRVSTNLYPKDDKLMPVKQPSEVWASTTTWPWPQLIKLDKQLYVCHETAIYLARPEGLELLLSSIPSRGYPWQAAIVGHFPIFTNNYSVVYPDHVSPLVERMEDVPYDALKVQTSGTVPISRDICEVNNQFVVAAPWIYKKWNRQHVAWAIPGTKDFSIGDKSAAGIRYVQDCGDLIRVIRTLDGFLAYGTTGVSRFAMAPYPASYNHAKISDVGLYSQRAAVDCDGFQAYVGTDMRLRLVSGNETKVLDYDYKFADALGEIVLHYDEEEKVIYASL